MEELNIKHKDSYDSLTKVADAFENIGNCIYKESSFIGIDITKCLHCGEGKPNYCEKCYQELIAENIKLRTQLDKLCTEMALLSVIKEVNNNESND